MLPLPLLLGNKLRAAASSRTKPDDEKKNASRASILPRVALSSPPAMPKAATTARDRRRSAFRTAGLCLTLALAAVFIVFAALGSANHKNVTSRLMSTVEKTISRTQPSARAREALSIFSPLSTSASSSSSSRRRHQRPQQVLRRREPPSTDAVVVAASLSLAKSPSSDSRPDAEFPPARVPSPLLSAAELLTLQHYARGSSYVEWGSGASTLLAAPMARRAVSIENQWSWCDEMLERSDVDFWIKNGVLTYLCADTGPTGELGMPRPEANPEHFRRYLSALDDAADTVMAKEEAEMEAEEAEAEEAEAEEAEAEEAEAKAATSSFSLVSLARFFRAGQSQGKKVSTASVSSSPTSTPSITTPTSSSSTNAFTVVLVDGRFRVACALKALWHIDHSTGVLLVHDWTLRKEQYHAPILKRYRLVTVIDRLALLVPSSPPAEGLASGDGDGDGDGKEQRERAHLRWWSEAAAELDRYSRDPA